MLTCLCDAFYGEVGIATVRVLEHVGCQVTFNEHQTCCGQPPFNAGDWEKSRPVASRCASLFSGPDPIVVPSASCAAMLREGYEMLGVHHKLTCYELCEFLHDVIEVQSWPSLPKATVATLHRSCHGRSLHLANKQEKILGLVPNLTVVSPEQADQCCGFGGAFSVTHSSTSRQIGLTKLHHLVGAGADTVIGGDMGCCLHLDGLARKEGIPLQFLHISEVLASAI